MATKRYLRALVRVGLAGLDVVTDSGHLTRCRAESSPLSRGRVMVAGDAAGLLEPWTREGISFALRSGALAGHAASTGPSGVVERYRAALVRGAAARDGRGRALPARLRGPAVGVPRADPLDPGGLAAVLPGSPAATPPWPAPYAAGRSAPASAPVSSRVSGG